ncbi:MAG: hypothetical protein IPK82_27825 [Polyangiaceae bacterium]|nr:hypothetical protein [Polyangiaceae bacterium]
MNQERPKPVTQYHLHGTDPSGQEVKIVFHAGDDNAMKLEYQDKEYQGRVLYRERSILGTIASIELEALPDLHTVFLSVVIPEANCPANMKSTAVHTFAVRTTTKTSIGGPSLVSGQIQTYEHIQLNGNAW